MNCNKQLIIFTLGLAEKNHERTSASKITFKSRCRIITSRSNTSTEARTVNPVQKIYFAHQTTVRNAKKQRDNGNINQIPTKEKILISRLPNASFSCCKSYHFPECCWQLARRCRTVCSAMRASFWSLQVLTSRVQSPFTMCELVRVSEKIAHILESLNESATLIGHR
jgi:hypothetical protein